VEEAEQAKTEGHAMRQGTLLAAGLVTLGSVVACSGPMPVTETAATTTEAPAAFDPSTVQLVGNRFAPLTYAAMTDAQREVTRKILAGPRTGLGGPFNVMLRSPDIADRLQDLGARIRFNTFLPDALREMSIIMTARHWTAHYEWFAHKNAALRAGLNPAIVDAIAGGQRPAGMSGDETALYDFCRELLESHQVDQATFDAAVAAFGERGVVDTIATVGYYSTVSMLLNVDEYPLPDGVEPELQPLAQ
jgi:4-carboxymuconolactone decarboxylase